MRPVINVNAMDRCKIAFRVRLNAIGKTNFRIFYTLLCATLFEYFVNT